MADQVVAKETYQFTVDNRNSRKRCKICSKLKIKTTERFGVFIVSSEHISLFFLVFLLSTLNMQIFAGILSTCEQLCLNFKGRTGFFVRLIHAWLIAIPSEGTYLRRPENRWKPQISIKTSLDLFP